MVDRMAVEIDGQGDPVVMIHGLGGTSNTWTPIMAACARMKVVRVDLPGSGRSHRVEGPLSIERFRAGVLRVCEALELPRVHLVGHSLGTIVAMHLAVSEPKRVRSLALFGPLAAPPDVVREGIRSRGRQAPGQGMQPIADALLQGAVSRDTRERRPLAVAAVRESLMRQDAEGYARTCEALADAQAADLARIECPTLLVTGDEDIVAPPTSVRALSARIEGSRVIVLPRCGHWTTFERAEECTQALRDFYAARR
jgi:pimeloyl-ACP methyl ester carboxylesterase